MKVDNAQVQTTRQDYRKITKCLFRHISVQQSLRSPNVFFRQQSLKLGLSLGPFSELPLTHYSQRKLSHIEILAQLLVHSAAIVVELECSLDVVLEGAQLLIAEEVLHKREDTLARR